MNDRTNRPERGDRDPGTNRTERRSSIPNDLPDSQKDREKLEPEETNIDLPDVKDIPGQEFVNAPPAGMLSDTTASSDDEEGRSIFERDDDEDFQRTGNDSDVSPAERRALERADYMPSRDEDNLRRASLDNRDFQGERLNEKGFGQESSGSDLDIPGNTDETETDAMGQGDEENKHYSIGGGENDNVVEGTP